MTLKTLTSDPHSAVGRIFDGAVVLVGGFGDSGYPLVLLEALADRGLKNLTIVSNNAGRGRIGISRLVLDGSVERLICSYPVGPGSGVFAEALKTGAVELELVPQGTLAERLRAAGSGLGGFLTPTGVGTEFAEDQEVLRVEGREYVLELPLKADFALIQAHQADPWGNLRYRYASQNFNPVMATAADLTIAVVDELVEDGLEPNSVHTPGIFVDVLVVQP